MHKETIENFFIYWWPSITDIGLELKQGKPTRKELYNNLLDADIRNKIILKDEELKQETYDRYFANRIFLTALLVKPENWSEEFKKKLTALLAYLNNNPEKRKELHPKCLQISLLKPIEKLLKHIQSGKKSDERTDFDLPIVMPQDAVTRREWDRIKDCLEEKQFQAIYPQHRNFFNKIQREELLVTMLASGLYHTALPIVKDMVERKETVGKFFFNYGIMKPELYKNNLENIELWRMLSQIIENKKNLLQYIELIEEMLKKNLPIQSIKPDFTPQVLEYDILYRLAVNNFDVPNLFADIAGIAAQLGHLDILKFLIEEKEVFAQTVKPTEYKGSSPLFKAISAGRLDVVNYLLSLSRPINSLKREGPALAYEAVRNKNLDILKILVEKKVDLSQPYNGVTPLSVARHQRDIPILLFLAENGIKIDSECKDVFDDEEEETLANILAREGNLDGLKELEKYLNFNYDVKGRNLIFISVSSSLSEDLVHEMIQFLVSKGIDINKKDQKGINAIFYAVDQGSLETVKVLLEFKADIKSPYRFANQQYNQNITLLHHAVLKGHTEIVEYLIQKGIDIHHQDDFKRSALICAAAFGQTKAFQLLAEYGADVNDAGVQNLRAVHFAARDKNLDLLQLLTEYKADFNVVTIAGQTPLDLAIERNFPDGVEFLLKQHAKFDLKRNPELLIKFLVNMASNANYPVLEKLLSDNFNQLLVAVISYIKKEPLPQQKILLDDIQSKKHFLGKILDKPTAMQRIRSSVQAQVKSAEPDFPLIRSHAFAPAKEVKQRDNTLPQLLAGIYDKQEPDYKYEKYELVLLSQEAGAEIKNDIFDNAKNNKTPILIKKEDKFSVYGDVKGDGTWQLTPIESKPFLADLFDKKINPKIDDKILKRDDPLFNRQLVETLQLTHAQYDKSRDNQPYKIQLAQLMKAIAQWAEEVKLGDNVTGPINQFPVHFYETALDKQPPVYYELIKKDLEKILYALRNPNINLARKKSELTVLAPKLRMCGPGLFGHIEDTRKSLEMPVSFSHWLADFRDKLIYQFAEDYVARTQLFEGNVQHAHAAFQIHAAKIGLAPSTRIQEINEHYLHLGEVKEVDYQRFKKTFLDQYNLKAIIDYMSTSFIAEFNSQRKEMIGETKEEVALGWMLYDPKILQIAKNILNSLDLNFDEEPFDRKEENGKEYIKFNPLLFKQLFLKECFAKKFLVENWSTEYVFGNPSHQLIHPASKTMTDLVWIRGVYKDKDFNEFFNLLTQDEQSHYFAYSLSHYITLDRFHLLEKPYDKLQQYFPTEETLKILVNQLEKENRLIANADFFKRMLQEDPEHFNVALALIKPENIKPLLDAMKIDIKLATQSIEKVHALTPYFKNVQYTKPSEKKFDPNTSILKAAEIGDIEMLRYLVEHKADLNLRDPGGETSLYLSLKNSHFEAALFLLGQGAEPEVLDLESTPLLLAVASDNTDVVQALLAYGANPFVSAEDLYAYDLADSPQMKKILLVAELDFLIKEPEESKEASALSTIKNSLSSGSLDSLKDISSSSPLVQDYLTKARGILNTPLEFKLPEKVDEIYTKKITEKSISYIALSSSSLELKNNDQPPVIKLRIPFGDREKKMFYQNLERHHWKPYSDLLIDLQAFQRNKTFNYELVQVDKDRFEAIYRFPELVGQNKAVEVVFHSKEPFDLKDPQSIQLLTSFEESLAALPDFQKGFIEIATAIGTVPSPDFKELVMYKPYYELFKQTELKTAESIEKINSFKSLVDVKAYPKAIAFCVRFNLKPDSKDSIKKLEAMVNSTPMLSLLEQKQIAPNEFLEIAKHFHPKDAAILGQIVKEVISKQGVDIKYLFEFDKKNWNKVKNPTDFIYQFTMQMMEAYFEKEQKEMREIIGSTIFISRSTYEWLKPKIDNGWVTANQLIESNKIGELKKDLDDMSCLDRQPEAWYNLVIRFLCNRGVIKLNEIYGLPWDELMPPDGLNKIIEKLKDEKTDLSSFAKPASAFIQLVRNRVLSQNDIVDIINDPKLMFILKVNSPKPNQEFDLQFLDSPPAKPLADFCLASIRKRLQVAQKEGKQDEIDKIVESVSKFSAASELVNQFKKRPSAGPVAS